MKLRRDVFDRALERAMGRIPEEIRRHLDNVIITVQRRPSRELLAELGYPPDEVLLGFYDGAPLSERSVTDAIRYPDRILIFQEPLEEISRTMAELEEEIEITLVHEVAHFLGLSEERLEELGYA